VELLDAWTVSSINSFAGLSYPESPCLFIEAAGTVESVTADIDLVHAVANEAGATDVVCERDQDARRRLWKARHDTTQAGAVRWPGRKVRGTDVCVPLTELAGAVRFARNELDGQRLDAGILGHAGDGNVHVSIYVDVSDPEQIATSDEFIRRVVDDALARGGTCTGEHGIGLGKIDALQREHGDVLPLMQGIKAVFDPRGILNPGKVLSTAAP
jgi:D-lactate dehydrogenase (cytochrome)